MNKTNIAEILNKFDLRESDFQRIRAVTPLLKRHLDSFIADFYAWMAQHQEYQVFFASNPARLERVKQLQRVTCRSRGASTSKRMRPQWQLPSWVIMVIQTPPVLM